MRLANQVLQAKKAAEDQLKSVKCDHELKAVKTVNTDLKEQLRLLQRTKDASERVEPAPDRDRDARLQSRISEIDRTINKELHTKQVPPNYRNEANAVAEENKTLRRRLDVKRSDVNALTS